MKLKNDWGTFICRGKGSFKHAFWNLPQGSRDLSPKQVPEGWQGLGMDVLICMPQTSPQLLILLILFVSSWDNK